MITFPANSKVLILTGGCFFVIGFIVSQLCKTNIPTMIQTQLVQQKSSIFEKKDKTEEIKNNVVRATEKVVNQKEFYPSGKVKEETQTNIVYNYKNLTGTLYHQNDSDKKFDSKLSNTTLIENPQKNWMLGGLIPAINYTDYSQYSLQVSYRVYGQIWASVQDDLSFSKPMVGIQVSF